METIIMLIIIGNFKKEDKVAHLRKIYKDWLKVKYVVVKL